RTARFGLTYHFTLEEDPDVLLVERHFIAQKDLRQSRELHELADNLILPNLIQPVRLRDLVHARRKVHRLAGETFVWQEAFEQMVDERAAVRIKTHVAVALNGRAVCIQRRERLGLRKRRNLKNAERCHKSGQQPPTSVQLRWRCFADDAQFTTFYKGRQKSGDAVRFGRSTTNNQLQQLLDGEHTVDACEFLDQRFAPLLPLPKIFHPRDEPSGVREPHLVRRTSGSLTAGGLYFGPLTLDLTHSFNEH